MNIGVMISPSLTGGKHKFLICYSMSSISHALATFIAYLFSTIGHYVLDVQFAKLSHISEELMKNAWANTYGKEDFFGKIFAVNGSGRISNLANVTTEINQFFVSVHNGRITIPKKETLQSKNVKLKDNLWVIE